MTEIDHAYAGTRAGDEQAFAAWVRLVETPLRASLRRFAPVVDVEAILQEGLVRMWRIAPGLELSGADASLHYVRRLARNLAISEARRPGDASTGGPRGTGERAGGERPAGPAGGSPPQAGNPHLHRTAARAPEGSAHRSGSVTEASNPTGIWPGG